MHCGNVFVFDAFLRPWSNQDVGFVNFKIKISMCVWFRRNNFLFRLAYRDMNLLLLGHMLRLGKRDYNDLFMCLFS